MVSTQVKNYHIPHQIIKVNGVTRHTVKGEKYWVVVRGTHVFQIGFLKEEDALRVAERVNGGVKLNPDLWKDKMPREVR